MPVQTCGPRSATWERKKREDNQDRPARSSLFRTLHVFRLKCETVFDLHMFVQHLYQTATGIKAHWPERLGEGVGGKEN